MKTYVVGTAGHVDHGKSTLVKHLTGIDPDRLREEKERQLTIDLGFAWLTLPGDLNVGIVDVPGHRDFIENMLAGVGGVDATLFVIAADEGIMPQTKEHLEILDLLEVDLGLVVLTKVDLIEDDEWLLLVEQEIRESLARTSLKSAPILRVSSKTGEGLEQLKSKLASILLNAKTASDKGRARMPVDRAFSLKGYGTIATGTLIDGHLNIGQAVYILPAELAGRVRGLQTHKQDVQMAVPGSRVAVNISGVDVNQINRGDVLVEDTNDQPTTLVDAKVRVLASSPAAIEHNQEVKLFIGADQKIARIRVLGNRGQIYPGETGWVQIMVREPVVVRRADRFVLRRPSPPLTLGGGKIIDPHPSRRYRLSDASIIPELERRLEGDKGQIVLSALNQLRLTRVHALSQKLNLPLEFVQAQIAALVDENKVVRLTTNSPSDDFYVSEKQYAQLVNDIEQELLKHHERFPLRTGMSTEELRNKLGLDSDTFTALLNKLTKADKINKEKAVVSHSQFTPTLDESEKRTIEELMKVFQKSPYAPPAIKDCQLALGEELYSYLVTRGDLIELSEEVVLRIGDFEQMVAEVRSLLKKKKTITVAETRDHFNTTRKYVLALLEHLDRQGMTIREGNFRRWIGEP